MKIIKVKTSNFLSLGNFEVAIDKNTNLNLIYGVNGAGKTNFIKIFDYIKELFSVSPRLLREMDNSIEKSSESFLGSFRGKRSISIYNKYVTLDSKIGENIKVELQFYCPGDDTTYKYMVEHGEGDTVFYEKYSILNKTNENDSEIIFEKKISSEKRGTVRAEWRAIDRIRESLDRYSHVFSDNIEYSIVSFFKNFIKLEETRKVVVNEKKSDTSDNSRVRSAKDFKYLNQLLNLFSPSLWTGNNLLGGFYGFAPLQILIKNNLPDKDKKRRISQLEEMVHEFGNLIKKIDKQVLGVKIGVEESVESSKYFAFIERKIDGKIRNIPISKESTGTKKYYSLYKLMKSIDEAFKYESAPIFMFDELGSNLNETLLIDIINYIGNKVRNNNVQIFITTHSAILLSDKFIKRDSKVANKEKWIINRNIKGDTKMYNLKGADPGENNHIKFILGAYGGNNLNSFYMEEPDE